MKILDKEEFRIKLEEINHLVENKDYKGAMGVVDSIDWRRVKNVRTLCVVGEIYAANKRYEDSKEIFLLAYHRAPIGKNILYRLIEVSLKMGDIEEAKDFYQEYKEVAPGDSTLLVLKYKILSAKNAPISEQIKVLEEYKEKEFTEKWSYELANLYYQAGEKEKCLELCNEMILWFNEGSYVMRAMDLKLRMGALTGDEKQRYEQQFVPKLFTPEEVQSLKDKGEEPKESSEEKEQPLIESIPVGNDKELSGVESLQEKISKGIRDIFGKRMESDEELLSEEYGAEDEMIKKPSDKELANAPALEPESGKSILVKEDTAEKKESADLKENFTMPELKIPESMKNFEAEETPEVPKAVLDDTPVFANQKEGKEFNLEDTILAAASAQGINIPEEPEEKETPVSEEEKIPEKEEAQPVKAATPVQEPVKEEVPSPQKKMVELEEEEFLSEEDLQEAEAEFLNGPKKPEEKSLEKSSVPEIPRLEDEELFTNDYSADDEPIEELKEKAAPKVPEAAEEIQPLKEESEEEKPVLSEEEELEQFIDSIQPKDERDPMDIIPRERTLTDEEKKLFTYFVKVPGMKEQLLDALLDAQLAAADKTSKTGNIIVMGGHDTGKTRLIGSLIPAICKERNIEASKVAYVFADQINGMDMSKVVDKLSGGFLVIEEANSLTPETVEELDKAMNFRTDGLTVILEDEKIGMRKLIAKYPKFAKKFTSMINIPVFTNDELVNFARVYTKENGYRIDQMGMLALYNLIGINQKEDEPMNIGSVKELLDNAISRSQGGLLKFNKKKRVDRDGYIVLYEKDFAK